MPPFGRPASAAASRCILTFLFSFSFFSRIGCDRGRPDLEVRLPGEAWGVGADRGATRGGRRVVRRRSGEKPRSAGFGRPVGAGGAAPGGSARRTKPKPEQRVWHARPRSRSRGQRHAKLPLNHYILRSRSRISMAASHLFSLFSVSTLISDSAAMHDC